MGGRDVVARMQILHCCTRCRFGTGAILRVPSLKDLPPAQLCEQCRCTVDLGAIGSGASTQQHIKSCLIVWEGGRVSSLQKLVVNLSRKEISSPRRESRPFTFTVPLKQTHSLCVLFDWHNRNQEVIVKARNFPQKTSRTWLCGKPNA